MSGSQRTRQILRSLAAAPTSPSAYAFLLVLLSTVIAKTYAAASIARGKPFALEAFGACAADLVVYPALALLIAAGERTRRWLAYLTYPLSLLAVAVALINAAYVLIANDQIDARVLDVGMNRIDEVADIALMEALQRAGRIGLYALAVLPLGYALMRLGWRRAQLSHEELGRLRVQGLAWLSALGAALFLTARVAGLPRTLGADLIADNALLHTYVTWLDSVTAPIEKYEGALEGHFAAPFVEDGALQRAAAAVPPPSMLVLVLESTRFDHVELPLPGHVSAVRTPHLRALAERGTFFTNVHANMPHTSKSLVTILCGRLPAMENPVLEATDGVLFQCLPELLRGVGHATAFMQSAIGSFEYRPRLTVRLGYDTFEAFETIDTPPLGYLAGDDRGLPPAFEAWLTKLPPERPFFATLLTSGTHHPYQVPDDVAVAPPGLGRDRYAALVGIEDQVLGAVVDALRRAGRLDDTILVAVADHGEGLPGDSVKQHDNNFFDESLRVPLIIAGPGVARGRHDGLMSLIDVAPTLLGLIGVRSVLPDNELRYGEDALRARKREIAPFACWNDQMCEGYVARDVKVVRMPADHRELAFERGDPRGETHYRAPTPDEQRVLERIRLEHALTRLSLAPSLTARPLALPSGFACGPGHRLCVHPSRPDGGFHPQRP